MSETEHQPTTKARDAAEKDSLYSCQSIDTLPRYTEQVETSQQSASAKHKSKLSSAVDHVKAKMSREPDTPERAAEKAAEKAKREEEYKRLGLGGRTKGGVGGMSWSG